MAALRAFSAKGEVRDFPSFNYSAREPPPSIPPSGPLHPLSRRPTISIQRKSPQRESLDSLDILPSVRSTAAHFYQPAAQFSFGRPRISKRRQGREREREGRMREKMRGGSRVKKNFKPGRKRFDANCPLFSSPRFRFVANATKFIVRHERVLFLVSLATLRPCVTRHVRGSLNN